jgi:hypothetical protein
MGLSKENLFDSVLCWIGGVDFSTVCGRISPRIRNGIRKYFRVLTRGLPTRIRSRKYRETVSLNEESYVNGVMLYTVQRTLHIAKRIKCLFSLSFGRSYDYTVYLAHLVNVIIYFLFFISTQHQNVKCVCVGYF